ncbi:hypothetical protein psal_cds_1219 [Pandoravirus salinus]|uniref:Uncharacterized protein n=1 Tax=Pandoravirus salinus TaxID=1349410 RepID=S4VXZ4_9VIRU|nr:hypothetical protein psal_cds_1219 [Pandoravirus salinus]AGO85529.1 hypothetical protein psal_cds_1219 [Pandoravirus salinus]
MVPRGRCFVFFFSWFVSPRPRLTHRYSSFRSMERLDLPLCPMPRHDVIVARDPLATAHSQLAEPPTTNVSRKRRALVQSQPTQGHVCQRADDTPPRPAGLCEDQHEAAAASATPPTHADRRLAATCPVPVRCRPSRRIHPMARIVQNATQYVCVGGRQLAVVDVAIALVIQAVQGKPGSCDTLLAQSWSLQDSALAVHGMCAHPGSIVVLTTAVTLPVSAPPPFTAATPRRLSDRAPLAYTAVGLFWLFGVLRTHGDPRLYDAMTAILRSGVLDDIGARLELAPVSARVSFSCVRAAANVAVVLIDDRCDLTAPVAFAASPGNVRDHTDGDKCTDVGVTTSGGGINNRHNDDPSNNNNNNNNNPGVISVAAAAMRNESRGADPWVIMGQGDRRRVVRADSREACALLVATGACLARRGVAARIMVDATLGPRVDDTRFRHHVEAAFGFVAA